jgi:hypothetical protein
MKNNENKTLKEIADQLMKIPGMTKGSELLTLRKYIEAKYGEEGVEKLEEKMKELGYPISFKKIKPAHWYPEAFNVLGMIVAKEIFGWQDLYEFGYQSPIFSFGVKIFIKILPLHLFLNEIPKIWKKFLDVGELEVLEFNEKEKSVTLALKNYKFHPEMCLYYQGFFLRLAEYIIKSEKITIKEQKCVFRGNDFCEFLIKWK